MEKHHSSLLIKKRTCFTVHQTEIIKKYFSKEIGKQKMPTHADLDKFLELHCENFLGRNRRDIYSKIRNIIDRKQSYRARSYCITCICTCIVCTCITESYHLLFNPMSCTLTVHKSLLRHNHYQLNGSLLVEWERCLGEHKLQCAVSEKNCCLSVCMQSQGLNSINTLHNTMKFTWEHSQHTITFRIYKGTRFSKTHTHQKYKYIPIHTLHHKPTLAYTHRHN